MPTQFPHQDTSSSLLLAQDDETLLSLDHQLLHHSCNLALTWEHSPCSVAFSRPPSLSSISSSPPTSPASSDEFDASIWLDSAQDYLSHTPHGKRMPKRRTSLQSILIPPFLSYPFSSTSSSEPQPSTHARLSSTSSLSHIPPPPVQPPATASLELAGMSPPDFLLDDDPFANHTGARPLQSYRSGPTSPPQSRRPSVKQPRSPLAVKPSPAETSSPQPVPVLTIRSPSCPSRVSPPSPPVGGRQLRPAYTRPAFAPRPSLPSLHSLAQSDFVYTIKARKGTLGARLPLEPWDVDAGPGRVSEEAPPLQGLDHATDNHHHQPTESMLGPEPVTCGKEDIHTEDIHDDPVDACARKDTHAHQDDQESLLPSPVSLEFGPDEGPNAFASLFDVLSSLSPPSLSRSSSTSSSSSVPVLSPDLQTQWGGDSPSRSPNRSSSDESVPADLIFDDDLIYPSSKEFYPDQRHSQIIDFLSMPGSFSMLDTFQPGTSAGTIRPPINSVVSDDDSIPDEDWPSDYTTYAASELHESDIFDEPLEHVEEVVDGVDQENRTSRRNQDIEGGQSSNISGAGGQGWRQGSAGGLRGHGRGSAGDGRRGGGDDRRKDERHWRAPSAFSTPSDTESESDESGEDDTRHAAQRSHPGSQGEVSTSDDNIPLAQRIPSALRVQRTIRKQVSDEKDERRRLRALRRQQQQPRQQTHKQTSVEEEPRHHAQAGPSSSQGPSQSMPSSTRPRTKTLPSSTSRPIVAEDLARRLRDIQESNALPMSFLNKREHSPSGSPFHSDRLAQRSEDHARIDISDKPLRPMRSFHRPRTSDAGREQTMPIRSLTADMGRVGRSATTASRPVKQHDQSEAMVRAAPPSRSRSTRRPTTSDGAQSPSVTPLHPSAFQQVSATRTPADAPDPPLPTQVVPKETKQVSWQQRVFIVDLQRFNTLLMNPTTTAKDAIDALETQGQLANWAGVGGWMLFEVFQDFGMERPIRHFEVISDVINSWDKDKSVNLLVAKKTPLATLLHPSAMPTSSPVFSTYVEWESKPRKWSKRWLELREQGLWLSKKDNGKDETFLCSLANFDAYVVTRIHKSPKPYVFAVKSTDNLSFFENPADYVHVFCCSEKDGKKWLENVLLARSYIIHQARNTLSVGTSGPSGKAPSRSSTRKGIRGAQQPLIKVPSNASTATTSFEPGSLLAKR